MTIRADAHGPEFLRKMPPNLPVRLATTANITLSAPQTIDGVAAVAEDRVLVKNQTTGSQNGVYIVKAGAWQRSFDMDEGVAAWGAVILVIAGTANGGRQFRNTNVTVPTIGTTALTFVDMTPVAGGPPTGAAGGDLGGTYPNPTVLDDSHNHSASTAPGGGGGGSGGGPMLIDSFVGNGTTTVFTLSVAPGGNVAIVTINGAQALPTSYSISGTTLTFTTAPANLAEVLVTQGGGAAGGGSSGGTIECAAQAMIYANGATTVSANSGQVGGSGGSYACKNLMQFPLAGVTSPKRAWLEVTILNGNNCIAINEGAGTVFYVLRNLRTDINYAQATWNVYKTGSNWTTAGANGNTTDRTVDRPAISKNYYGGSMIALTGAIVQTELFDITPLFQAAVAAGASNLDIQFMAGATGGQNQFTIGARTDATVANRPRVVWQ